MWSCFISYKIVGISRNRWIEVRKTLGHFLSVSAPLHSLLPIISLCKSSGNPSALYCLQSEPSPIMEPFCLCGSCWNFSLWETYLALVILYHVSYGLLVWCVWSKCVYPYSPFNWLINSLKTITFGVSSCVPCPRPHGQRRKPGSLCAARISTKVKLER